VTGEALAGDGAALGTASLVDFGGGRRLERLGGVLVDRPHPAAEGPRRSAAAWNGVHLRIADGGWQFLRPLPHPWLARVPLPGGRLTTSLVLHLRPAPSGQIGLFLEQVEAVRWLAGTLHSGDRVLSLFAHTGIATLAAAAAGGVVTHVDASRQALQTARENVAASGMSPAAIRWIHDDCKAFVSRLARRGERFRGLVLDPPSWGHGPKGQPFSIDDDLSELMDLATGLLETLSPVILLTAHTPGWTGPRLTSLLEPMARKAASRPRVESGVLACEDEVGRRLCLGHFARLEAYEPNDART